MGGTAFILVLRCLPGRVGESKGESYVPSWTSMACCLGESLLFARRKPFAGMSRRVEVRALHKVSAQDSHDGGINSSLGFDPFLKKRTGVASRAANWATENSAE